MNPMDLAVCTKTIPTPLHFWEMIRVCLKQPTSIKRIIAVAARQRLEDVRHGHYGDSPLPKVMDPQMRSQLKNSLESFWWFAQSAVDDKPLKQAIADLVPAATNCN
jgi:hypothetical protein